MAWNFQLRRNQHAIQGDRRRASLRGGGERTLPGEYYHWHVDAGPGAFSERQMVAIRPAQGKLTLFPPFWTHVHRGVMLEKGVKYIATTWICFA